MPTANETLQDRLTRHQVFLMRFSPGVARRMIQIMNSVDEDLVNQIRRLSPEDVGGINRKRARLEKMLERVREINEATRAQVLAQEAGELTDLASAEVAFAAGLFSQVTNNDVPFILPRQGDIRAAALSRPFQGIHLKWVRNSAHLAEQYRRRGRLLRDEIRRGFIEGESTESVVRRIRGTAANNFKDGVLEISRREATIIARTAINHTANRAREAFYEENAQVMKGLRWLAVLDGRTSAVCRGRDGKVAPVGAEPLVGVAPSLQLQPPNARPPAHPNCRSVMVPVLKSLSEIGLDVPGFDGDIPQRQTYNEWLRTQDRAFINDVLGKTKAKLYLDGDLTLDKFINRAGDELTLDQLKRREADAFRKAGI